MHASACISYIESGAGRPISRRCRSRPARRKRRTSVRCS